ncbi:MAG: ABC transporter ATP-binding protein [Desulfomonilaceae bacterium]|nr:ABC transporter ATP-binding protein [Desulfomonilaceae bacterium]
MDEESKTDEKRSGPAAGVSRNVRVAVSGVSKYFGGTAALSGIDLEVREGEFCVLLGPSGCGKSTLLRVIAGLESPSEGRVFINGSDVTHTPPGDRNVAMVFQNYAIYPHMTVFDNIAFPLKLRKIPKKELENKVREAARLLQLEDFLQRKPSQLSGGQRQRVAMGRAIVRDPTVFLFDEPLSNLDARLRVSMRIEIARLHRNLNATTVYVTHDQVEAMTLADRIVVLENGTVQQSESPRELYDHPANIMVARFIGSPPMNLVQGTIKCGDGGAGGHFQSESLNITLPDCAYEGRAIMGIRPEHITVDPAGFLRGTVEFVEDTGSDRYAHVAAGREIFVVRVPAGTEISPGISTALTFDPEKLHIFPAD